MPKGKATRAPRFGSARARDPRLVLTGAEYLRQAFDTTWTYRYVGKDGAGNDLYEKFLNGKHYSFRALLPLRRWKERVRKVGPNIGVSKWVDHSPTVL